MRVRRVVTGHTLEGKAIFASDEQVDPIDLLTGNRFHRLWGGDATPSFPDDGSLPPGPGFFPPVGGFRFVMITVPPSSRATPPGLDPTLIYEEMQAKVPGMAEHLEEDAPGMHTTDTIDFEYVISGRAVLELDDGERVEIGPGDTVVQNGTRHAWHNPYDEPCRMVGFLLGAERK